VNVVHKRYMKTNILLALTLAATFAGCTGSDDEEMYLTGTEEYAVTLANGQLGCENPKKVLVCHIPPGNPENAHTICVGAAAVKAHEKNHGDGQGACAGEPGDDDPPPPPPPGDDPPTGDGPVN
jgi:hypothetical protein